MSDFEKIISTIENNEKYDQSDLFQYLISHDNEERALVCCRLSQAFCQRGDRDLGQAEIFAKRAFTISKDKFKYASQLIDILIRLKESEELKKIYKRMGLECLRLHKLKEALSYFDQWLYTSPEIHKIDKYEYDWDILDSINSYVGTKGFVPNSLAKCLGKKLRIGLLVKDITALNSALVKINYLFAKYYNRNTYELYFFFPETKRQIIDSKQGEDLLKIFHQEGVKCICADDYPEYEDQLFSVVKKIKEENIILLITSAALSLFSHYYITSFKPAPLTLGLSQGPPPQFIPPLLDWCIAWTYHPLIDSPVPTSYVKLQADLPHREDIVQRRKEFFGIPEESQVVLAGGRHVKFQDRQYIHSLLQIIKNDSKRYLVIVGPSHDQISFITELADEKTLKRVKIFPWMKNYLELTQLADVVIDTYPSGGGIILIEAAALGIPVITFQNNYLKEYDQTDWSPFQEFIDINELKLQRGDYDSMTNLADRLLCNEQKRIEMGNQCAEEMLAHVGNPKITIAECEKVIMDLILSFFLKKLFSGEIEESKINDIPETYEKHLPSMAVSISEDQLTKKEYSKAISILSKMNKILPNNPEFLCNLGLAYYYTGNVDKALQYLRTAIEKGSVNPIYTLNIASILSSQDQIQEAINVCRKYISENKEDKEIGEYLIELENNL